MKKSEELFSKIDHSIQWSKKVRVHFNSNTKIPQFGQFVRLEDADELKLKGFARFVSESKLLGFQTAASGRKRDFTRLLIVQDLLTIILF